MDEIALRLRGEPGGDAAVRRRVEEIIAVVRDRGDEALVSLTRELDAPDFSRDRLRVAPGEAEAALESAPEALVDSLRLAADNIRLFHQHELRGDWTAPMRQNQMLGQRMIPVGRAGLYVPGGGADYPSSVLMTVIPAQVAGVGEICICTPPDREGRVSQPVLAAAAMMEVGEIYRCGGAQAIAAMAYGTGSIRPVDVVAGPGNVYVTEAKRQVFGRVGIDGLAGPSEVLVIAGGDAAADLIAADLLAQTEHGSGAIAVLVSWSPELLERVEEEAGLLQRELGMDERLLDRITLVLVEGDDPQSLAMAFSNRFAPEHLQIHTEQPEQDAHDVSAAGAVFLGEDVCTAYGDYIIGSNHVLPTAGSARYGSALSVENFLRKVAVISLIPATVSELTPSLVEIARAEGLRAHARAAELRLERFGQAEEEDEE
jgi:histidinol dehydrogenase